VTARPVLSDLSDCGAHRHGHFRLSSGLHSADYLQCALYLAQPQRARRAGGALARAILEVMSQPTAIVSPAIGGLIIGHETAAALEVPFLFAERSANHAMALRRGFTLRPGQTVVVVEDVVTTGGSSREVVEVVRRHGAVALGVASLVNRSGQPNPFEPLPFVALIAVEFPTWRESDCPLCRDGLELERPGSRPIG
jgi:orotate phosphoribosyltransferase